MSRESYRDRVFLPSLRLCLLRVLKASPREQANSAVLESEANRWGFGVRREVVNQELVVLEELGAVTTERLSPDVVTARLAEPGAKHLTRDALIEGIEAPTR